MATRSPWTPQHIKSEVPPVAYISRTDLTRHWAWIIWFGRSRRHYGYWSVLTPLHGNHRCYCWSALTNCEVVTSVAWSMSWLILGFWGCALMWVIGLAGDLGLARNPNVAPGLEWLALICAIIAFIGMCYFGHQTAMFGW
jgi:hypothetical protein